MLKLRLSQTLFYSLGESQSLHFKKKSKYDKLNVLNIWGQHTGRDYSMILLMTLMCAKYISSHIYTIRKVIIDLLPIFCLVRHFSCPLWFSILPHMDKL